MSTRTSADIQSERDAIANRIEKLNSLIYETQKPFLEQAEALTVEMKKEQAELRIKGSKLYDEFYKVEAVERRESWNNKVPMSPVEFAHWCSDTQPFERKTSFSYNLDSSFGHPSKRVRQLNNKITVFSYNDLDEKYYGAFNGRRNVGLLHYYVSQHPGDDSRLYKAVVNGKDVSDKFHKTAGNYGSVVKPVDTFLKLLEGLMVH